MRTTNTGYFGPGDPIMRHGLSGLGAQVAADMTTYGGGDPAYTDPTSGGTGAYVPDSQTSPWYADKSLWTAVNSEALFASNLYRGLTNQAPLPASQYAPQVAVGLNSQTINLLMLGGGALLLMSAMKGGKRRKRR